MLEDLKILIKVLSCGDFKTQLNNDANGEEFLKKKSAFKYLTSTIPCIELKEHFIRTGGWE